MSGFLTWKGFEFEFGQKGNVSDEDFMIHVLNNLPKEYNVILDGLENCLMATLNNQFNS